MGKRLECGADEPVALPAAFAAREFYFNKQLGNTKLLKTFRRFPSEWLSLLPRPPNGHVLQSEVSLILFGTTSRYFPFVLSHWRRLDEEDSCLHYDPCLP